MIARDLRENLRGAQEGLSLETLGDAEKRQATGDATGVRLPHAAQVRGGHSREQQVGAIQEIRQIRCDVHRARDVEAGQEAGIAPCLAHGCCVGRVMGPQADVAAATGQDECKRGAPTTVTNDGNLAKRGVKRFCGHGLYSTLR